MSSFDHYPDMNHDGKHDVRDSALFHEVMNEDTSDSGTWVNEKYYDELSRKINLDDNLREKVRADRQAERIAKGILLAILGGYILLIMQFPPNGFTAVTGLLAAIGFIRTLLIGHI